MEFCISFDIFLRSSAGYKPVLTLAQTSQSNYFTFLLNTAGMVVKVGEEVIGNYKIPVRKWHNIRISRVGTNKHFYLYTFVNGSEVGRGKQSKPEPGRYLNVYTGPHPKNVAVIRNVYINGKYLVSVY